MVVSRRWFLHLGTNLILPGRGAPSGSATPFFRGMLYPEIPSLLYANWNVLHIKFFVTETEREPYPALSNVRSMVFAQIHFAATVLEPRVYFYSEIRKSLAKSC